MAIASGFEIGRFTLKPGMDEASLVAASRQMESRHLENMPGFIAHHLVRLEDGVYLDLVFAGDKEAAQAICASWIGQPDCEAFLAMIVPESMQFGIVL